MLIKRFGGTTVYELRQATEGDYEFLKRLHHAAMRDVVQRMFGWDEVVQDRMFDEGFKPGLSQIVSVDGQDAAQLVVERGSDHVCLTTIFILPKFQRRGLGTAIINDVLAEAARAHLPVVLRVLKLNPARGLYERLGFAVASEDETHFTMRADAPVQDGMPLVVRKEPDTKADEDRDGRQALYGEREADCSHWREALRPSDRERFELLVEHAVPCRRLVDIGCGWGQFLGLVQDQVEEIWAVDESPDRMRDIAKACPKAKQVVCRADRLELPDAHFGVAVTAQMLHEVKLFGQEGELQRTLSEVYRILAPGGRWLLLDHLDAGDSTVVVRLPTEQMARLAEFERKFRFYQAGHESLGDDAIRISRRCLQDFLTKSHWLNTDMEAMEMDETHNAFGKQETIDMIAAAEFAVRDWIAFTNILHDLDRHGGTFVEGEPWFRKFLVVAERTA